MKIDLALASYHISLSLLEDAMVERRIAKP